LRGPLPRGLRDALRPRTREERREYAGYLKVANEAMVIRYGLDDMEIIKYDTLTKDN
jgi:hypothetical protein